ncbi:melanoma cell adhesion molecule b isoform X2 [Paramisgurnus dabryanus]|uniref:melanoma cell adhesion molecule b isoform X2 n=1 Tax=Paramisgurnus dabryanus TaxID=90735 RepID=UPI0031F39A31
MGIRYISLILAGLHVLTCTTWASVEVSMEDRVEVSLNSQAKISCLYSLYEKAMRITWSKKLPGKEQSKKIFQIEGVYERIDDKSYMGRLNVTHSYDVNESRGSIILTIDRVTLNDEAEFICTVYDLSKDYSEGHTLLQVFNPPSFPVIVGTHSGISVTEEKPSKVADCKVDNGYPKPNITWYKNNFPLHSAAGDVEISEKETKNPSGLFTVESELLLKVVREDEDVKFYCEVNYFLPGEKRMTESDPINITVHYPTTHVTMSINPPEKLFKEGDTVEIRCKGNGNPQPIFTFMHNNKGLLESSDNDFLILDDVKRSDSGTYVCQAFDIQTPDIEDIEDSINITVHYFDEIVVTPKERVLDQGDDLTLTCNALSSLPTYKAWYKDEIQLGEEQVLHIHNASLDTAGMYTCEVTVVDLPELSKRKSLQINVREKPEITEITVGPKDMDDNSVNLTCYAQGFPIPTISWDLYDLRTDQPLNETSVENQNTGEGIFSVISVIATSDFTANCSASNDLGTTTVSRDVTARPSSTTILPSTTATETSVPESTVPESSVPKKPHQQGGSGVIIAVIIICLLLLAILGSFLYFLYKKGRLPCGRSGTQDFTKENASKDDVKSGKSEEAVLLQGVNAS